MSTKHPQPRQERGKPAVGKQRESSSHIWTRSYCKAKHLEK